MNRHASAPRHPRPNVADADPQFVGTSRLALCAFAGLLLLASCRNPAKISADYVSKANEMFKKGNYAQARDLYTSALSANSHSSAAWYGLGLTHEALHMQGDARSDYAAAFKANNGNLQAAAKLAEMDLYFYFLYPQRFKALEDQAVTAIEAIAAKDPNAFEVFSLSGAIAAHDQHYAAAIDKYTRAIQIRPADIGLKLTLAQVLFAANRPDEAIRLCYQVIDQDKTYAPMYDLLFSVYMASKQVPRAEEILKRKLANNPGHIEYQVQLSDFYRTTNREKQAEALIATLAAQPNQSAQSHALLGAYYGRAHRYDEAIIQYAALENSGDRNLVLLSRKKIIEMLVEQDRCTEATPFLERLRASDPRDTDLPGLNTAVLFCRPSKADTTVQ